MPVYLIRAGETGPVKIGHGKDVLRRLANLQIGSSEKLTLLRVLVGGADEEAALHHRFRHLHARGEWFSFTPDMLGDLGLVDQIIPRTKREILDDGKRDIRSLVRLCGGPSAVAAEIKRTHTTVIGWTVVPLKYVPAVSKLSGLPFHEIRPDFPWPTGPNALPGAVA